MTQEQKIRQELQETLSEDSSNYSKILELSSKLASFDKNHVRFSVDAGVIDRLGRELVARQETAVSELVKNAYDADAKKVNLTFEDSDDVGGILIVEDNGTGMNRSELIEGFMRISSTGKIHNPNSSVYSRRRAGRKGIGRFAVQRLGRSLEIVTKTKNDKRGIRLFIDWDQYFADTNLLTISNKIELVDYDKNAGTTLTIKGLRDKWTEASIKRIYRYVAAIIQPYPLSKEHKSEETSRIKKTSDPGFAVTLYKKTGKKREAIADESSMIFKHAVAVVEGYIDENGNGIYSVESKRLNIDKTERIGSDRDKSDSPFSNLRNIQFKAYYFIYHPDLIPTQQRTYIQELAEEIGGIRLYNNGFRVLPYGEPFVDWLRLDQSVRKRQILPAHGNNNFFGFVEVNENSNLLEETSSREGLQENQAFSELQNFVYRCLIASATEVARARGVKEKASQKNWDKKKEKPRTRVLNFTKRIIEEAEAFEKELKTLPEYSDKTKNALGLIPISSRVKDMAKEIEQAILEQGEEEELLIKELGMLRILASLGLTIGEFTHEIRHYLVTLKAKLKIIKKAIEGDKKLESQVEQLSTNIKTLEGYTSYFDRAISDNVTRDLRPQEMQDIVNSFVHVITSDMKRSNIEMWESEINDTDLYTTSMHPSEWASVLFNLYTNSKKAIKRVNTKGIIFLKAGVDGSKIFLEFSDNGDGIPEKNEDKIFDAFFTTSSPVGHFASEQDEILGTGLGLKIVKDIITSYGGDIKVVNPPKNLSTCLRIEIPKASEDEMNSL